MTATWLGDLLAPAAPTTQSLVLGTPLQISTTRPARVCVVVELAVNHGQDCTVTATSDSANPPTTVQSSCRQALTDDAASVTTRFPMEVWVQPGDFLLVAKTGTGTATLITAVANLMP